MRRHWTFRVAAYLYFGIAALVSLALLLAPWVAQRPVPFGFYLVGAVLTAVPIALGVWSERVYKGRYSPSQNHISAGTLPAIALGPLSQNLVVSAVFLIPLLFVVAGWHASRE